MIHRLGPIYGVDEPADQLPAACDCDTLQLATKHTVGLIACPAFSTGAFGYPKDLAAQIALTTVLDVSRALLAVKLIRFVLFTVADLELH